jgi:hypothetical protein
MPPPWTRDAAPADRMPPPLTRDTAPAYRMPPSWTHDASPADRTAPALDSRHLARGPEIALKQALICKSVLAKKSIHFLFIPQNQVFIKIFTLRIIFL